MLVGLLSRWCFLIGGHGRRQWAGRTGDFGGLRKIKSKFVQADEKLVCYWSSGVDSRFDRRGDMTSITNWSERTDSTDTLTTTTGLGASPSRVTTGDELIAEKSDLFREAIRARNVYAAWARKLTNARPNDPKLQEYHQEVTKAGERVNLLLSQLDVPLFRIPASEKELDKILIRLKNKPIDPPVVKNQKSKTAAVPPSPPASPRKGKRRENEALIRKASLPPKQLVRKARSPRLSPPPSPTPPSATSVEDARLEGEEEEMDSSQPAELQDQVVVPEMSGRFLKVTVGDELEYRNLSHWLEQSGVEFKSFMLKQDRPIKVVIRGLPSNTEPEDIKNEIEAEGFKVAKISQMKNYRSKAPMPLFYLQIENGVEALKIYDFTELFGTRIEVKPFERGNKRILKKIFNSGSNCIIAGDFNASHVDWHNVKNTRYGISLRNLVSNLRGAKLVAPQTATHLQPRQRFGSVIDLAVFKHIPYNHSVRVLSDLSSDHYPVILEINLNTSLIKNPEQLSTNWSNFKFVLSKKPLPSTDLTSNENIELAISELNQNFSEAFVEASKPKFKNAPKILSPEIKSKIYQRNRLRKFWQRSRCPSIYSEFRTLSREIAKDIKSHSQAQWEKHIEALSPEDNTLWRNSSLYASLFVPFPLERGSWQYRDNPY
ncbi:RNA-directed DNA polymerase from mobile element jockey [Trichonephila clavipes]|nr:RNA-directed DNA polymerase from mobile element jockey [Trichonephila clavipes]